MRATHLLAGTSIVLAACAANSPTPMADASAPLTVVSDTTAPGFGWPESVGCDTAHNVLYVSQFGGEKPNPPAKDGLGYISKVAPDGKVIEKKVFDVTMNKPKGIWIEGTRLWVTDIDSLWLFDTATKQYKHVMIPGITFANDVALWNGAAYVGDNRADQLYRIEPADFLATGAAPRISLVWEKKGIFPNGLWPGKDGRLIMAGFESAEKHKGIWAMSRDGTLEELSKPIGRLDGLQERPDGTLLATDWDSGSVFRYGPRGHVQELGKNFKGPADLCVMGDTVYVPDLVKGEVRMIKLDR
ncbi:MAG TPA: hypothetical protein VH301_14740 [Usitatibacter sp.]|nr:hypothetical protein [Usitatibacter sp.]